MNDEQFKKLVERIDILIKLTALNTLKEKTPKEKVKTLSGLGLKPFEIARVIDKSRNYVDVALHRIRKEEKKIAEKEEKMPKT